MTHTESLNWDSSSVPGKDTVNIHRWDGGLKPVTVAFSKEVEMPGLLGRVLGKDDQDPEKSV